MPAVVTAVAVAVAGVPRCCRVADYWVASTTHWWNSARASGVPLMVTGVGVLGVSRFQVQRRMLDGEPDTTTSGLSGMVKAVPGPPVTVSSVGEVVIVQDVSAALMTYVRPGE